jgi:hypothetical protein
MRPPASVLGMPTGARPLKVTQPGVEEHKGASRSPVGHLLEHSQVV